MNDVDELLLEHFGTKGMRWGVRRQRRQQALVRGGTKGGFKSSRVRASGRVGPVDFVKGGGVRGGAQRKATRVSGQLNRFDRGEATKSDIIKRYGSTRVSDLIPVREKNAGKITTHKADIAVVTAVGALVAYRVLRSAARARV